MGGSRNGGSRVCTPKYLPRSEWARAEKIAVEVNPANKPDNEAPVAPDERLAADKRVYWGETTGVRLTVGFLDNPECALRAKILSHMNAWSQTANVQFVESNDAPQVRIARTDSPGMGGYWSYLGTDILTIPRDQPTMNLEGFTMNTPDAEFVRVVRHETGHTMGFPHEHMRKELVERLDREKVIDAYMASQGWSRQEVINQILTPLEESSLIGGQVDANSIMCYQIDGSLTLDGEPIPGGLDIDESDYRIAARLYPKN